MLVLTRKHQEKIRIGDHITITVLKTKGKAVRLGIEAPPEVAVIRGELAAAGQVEHTDDESVSNEGKTRSVRRRRTELNGALVGSNWASSSPLGNKKDRSIPDGPAVEVSLRRVPRVAAAQLVGTGAAEAGPLRAMLDRRS